jgi:GNAT superfamily N-acetyltransferase
VCEENVEAAARFMVGWVSADEADARQHLADRAGEDGASLAAVRGQRVIGIASIVWESNYAGFAERGIPLLHQLAVAGPFRRQGVAMMLMDAAENMARHRGAAELGIRVGLFDDYGPAHRDARVAWAMAEELNRRLYESLQQTAVNAFGTVPQRVAAHLLDLASAQLHPRGRLVAPACRSRSLPMRPGLSARWWPGSCVIFGSRESWPRHRTAS